MRYSNYLGVDTDPGSESGHLSVRVYRFVTNANFERLIMETIVALLVHLLYCLRR